jgi:branched-chain amino acid transport system substrate-binding protein
MVWTGHRKRTGPRAGAATLACLALAAVGAATGAELKIGNIASTTNPTARVNAQNLAIGYRTYFEHINRQGGVAGNTLRLVQLDDDVNPKRMVELTDQLIADPQVIALAGFLNTPGIAELARENVMGKRGIALVAPIAGTVSLAPNMFPLRATYFDELAALLKHIRDGGKKRIGVVYFNQAFGPAMFKYAQSAVPEAGLEIVVAASFETAPDKIAAAIAAAAAKISAGAPEAVIVFAGGLGASEFVKSYRATPHGLAQLYTLSAVDALTLVKVAGLASAKGVIISQAVPFPEGRTLRVVREYQDLMKQYAPGEPFTYFGLEGFMGAKIVVEALRRAGPEPTRAKLLAALRGLKYYDLGDFEVNYAEMERWRRAPFVELSVIGSSGKLFR